MIPDSYIPPFCKCGGYLSGKFAAYSLLCSKCNTVFEVVPKDE